MPDLPTLRFSPLALLALPDRLTRCDGARLDGNHIRDGGPQVRCRFYPGEGIRAAPPPGLPGFTVVLSPADARSLARALERSAEEAEEQ